MVICLAAVATVVGGPLPRSAAMYGDLAKVPAGQVRIFDDGVFTSCGTLVGRNWALTTLKQFRHDGTGFNPDGYSLRFGVTRSREDSTANLRQIDRIVPHETFADVALVHFRDPVPEGTYMPPLGAQAPSRLSDIRVYGWGPEGVILGRLLGVVIDPVASGNAEILRGSPGEHPDFRKDFPRGIDPLVANPASKIEGGDDGGGMFGSDDQLLGMMSQVETYRPMNSTGRMYGGWRDAIYAIPVWKLRDWIRQVVDSDEGPSNSGSGSGSGEGNPRRRLSETSKGTPLMTEPPHVDVCDPGDTSCTLPDPKWAEGAVLGSGTYRGTALAVCAQVSGNSCSFDGTAYEGGKIGRLELGPSTAPGTTPRRVMIWCQSSAVFGEGAAAQPALQVSFTNADGVEAPVGYGWWNVTPDQVGVGADLAAADLSQFATC